MFVRLQFYCFDPMKTRKELIAKYDKPVPRYTSYPTVPAWLPDSLGPEKWKEEVRTVFHKFRRQPISLYLHLPFCEKLCTYCGCNKKITNNHKVEDPYIETLLAEWDLYLQLWTGRPLIGEIHLGGGTPTFFSPENLERLMTGILKHADVVALPQFSVEVHPVVTTPKHIEMLAKLGFRRLSAGIQDFDPEVQRLINRIQSPEQTFEVIQTAREQGFEGINVDLIYGLPRQTQASIHMTIEEVHKMRPDRIAFYSYAHVPWKSPGQRLYDEHDLPSGEEKRALYETGRALLTQYGYTEIGMDHFALPGDPLLLAAEKGMLHRNFMGYTTEPESLLIGLGASSISDTGTAFHQNEKDIRLYQQRVMAGEIPFFTGHRLSEEDKRVRQQIQDIMCSGYAENVLEDLSPERRQALSELELDGLVELSHSGIQVTDMGKMFLRNICSVLDRRMIISDKPVFSQSV